MDNDEINDRLDEANRGGKGGKYEPEGLSEKRGQPQGSNKSSAANTQFHSEHSDESGSEEELFNHKNNNASNVEEEEEDLKAREEELRAELNFATLRCEELKRTLQETKSFLGPRLPTRGKDTRAVPTSNVGHHQGNAANHREVMREEEEEEEEDEDLYDLGEEDDNEDEPISTKGGRPSNLNTNLDDYYPKEMDGADRTVRRIKPLEAGGGNVYNGLEDAPSPSGKLSDRIERLRVSCMEALGRDAFFDAYNFLRQHEQESQGYDNGRDMNDDDFEARKLAKVRAILGEGKAHYISLIDQLLFMEGAERD